MKAKCSATVDMRFKDLEEIQDLNSDAVACNTFEESLLVSLDNCLHLIDMRDKVLNNEPEIVQARKLVRQAREYNAMGLDKDKAEMRLLDDRVPMFPEYCIKKTLISKRLAIK